LITPDPPGAAGSDRRGKNRRVLATLSKRVDEAGRGILAITAAERDKPAEANLLPEELVKLAELMGRLRIID
jgi:hypothetical protein